MARLAGACSSEVPRDRQRRAARPDVIATAGFPGRSRRAAANLNARYVGRQRYDNDQDNVFATPHAGVWALLDAQARASHRQGERSAGSSQPPRQEVLQLRLVGRREQFFAYPQAGRAVYLSLAIA